MLGLGVHICTLLVNLRTQGAQTVLLTQMGLCETDVLSVYDNNDSVSESAPSPSPRSSLKYVHRCIGYGNPTRHNIMSTSVRLMCLSVYDSRDIRILPVPPLLVHTCTQEHRLSQHN